MNVFPNNRTFRLVVHGIKSVILPRKGSPLTDQFHSDDPQPLTPGVTSRYSTMLYALSYYTDIH